MVRIRPTAAIAPPMYSGSSPRSRMPSVRRTNEAIATMSPTTTAMAPHRESGCHVGSGATSNRTSTSPDRAARSSRILMSRARRRSTDWRRTDSGMRRWMGLAQAVELGGDLGGLPEPLEPFPGRRALGLEALGLAGLLEHAPSLGQGGLRVGAPLPCRRQAVAIALQLREGQLPLLDRRSGGGDGPLSDLEAAGVLVALGGQVVEGLLEALPGPAGPTVGAADARLKSITQGGLVTREVAQLVVPDRGGRTEEGLGRDARQFGQHLVGEGRVGDRLALVDEGDRALGAGERLLERSPSPCRPPRPVRSRSRPTAGCPVRRPTAAGRRGRRRRS